MTEYYNIRSKITRPNKYHMFLVLGETNLLECYASYLGLKGVVRNCRNLQCLTCTYYCLLALLTQEGGNNGNNIPMFRCEPKQCSKILTVLFRLSCLRYHCGIQVKGPHLTLGTHPFTPNSGFTTGTPVYYLIN